MNGLRLQSGDFISFLGQKILPSLIAESLRTHADRRKAAQYWSDVMDSVDENDPDRDFYVILDTILHVLGPAQPTTGAAEGGGSIMGNIMSAERNRILPANAELEGIMLQATKGSYKRVVRYRKKKTGEGAGAGGVGLLQVGEAEYEIDHDAAGPEPVVAAMAAPPAPYAALPEEVEGGQEEEAPPPAQLPAADAPIALLDFDAIFEEADKDCGYVVADSDRAALRAANRAAYAERARMQPPAPAGAGAGAVQAFQPSAINLPTLFREQPQLALMNFTNDGAVGEDEEIDLGLVYLQ
jgi:hypothetical protein